MKSIIKKIQFARNQGISHQLVDHRIKKGYKFGRLNGVLVMYNPKTTNPVSDENLADLGVNFLVEEQLEISDEA